MSFFEVTAKNAGAFASLAPPDMLEELTLDPSTYGIGATIKQNDADIPVGILIFSVRIRPKRKVRSLIRHLWLYVKPEQRGMGFGSELFYRSLSGIEKLSPAKVVVDIYRGNDREWIIPFYEAHDFRIVECLHYRARRPLAEMLDPWKAAIKSKVPYCRSVAEDKRAFNDCIKDMPKKDREWVTPRLAILEREISTLCYKDGKPVGALLILRHASQTLEPVYLRTDSGCERMIPGMIGFTGRAMLKKYTAQTDVLIQCQSMRTRRFMAKLYPDIRPVQGWHGECICLLKRTALQNE